MSEYVDWPDGPAHPVGLAAAYAAEGGYDATAETSPRWRGADHALTDDDAVRTATMHLEVTRAIDRWLRVLG